MKCYAMTCKRETLPGQTNCLPHFLVVLISAKILHLPYAVTYWLMGLVYRPQDRPEVSHE